MQVKVLREAGYEQALYGLSLSFKDRAIPPEEWWTQERRQKAQKRIFCLADKDGGHNKVMESIVVWIDIEAPRFWWQEADTYRIGISKQSEGTMHTLAKRPIEASDFETPPSSDLLAVLNTYLYMYRNYPTTENLVLLKAALPEGYLQRRVVCTNYKTLRNIILQRWDHQLPQWQSFVREVLAQVEHPELLPQMKARETLR
jgi:hypothetical protein